MEKRILFISEKKTMIANALIQAMEEKAFQVIQVKANVTEISRMDDKPEIWILYLQGVERSLLDLLSYIKDQIKEHGFRLFVIGTPEEREAAKALLLQKFDRACWMFDHRDDGSES